MRRKLPVGGERNAMEGRGTLSPARRYVYTRGSSRSWLAAGCEPSFMNDGAYKGCNTCPCRTRNIRCGTGRRGCVLLSNPPAAQVAPTSSPSVIPRTSWFPRLPRACRWGRTHEFPFAHTCATTTPWPYSTLDGAGRAGGWWKTGTKNFTLIRAFVKEKNKK